jgi:NAD(P)-dependent dehydrogenase (short-subunit alcohol dehydrogenase family)
VTGAAGGIGRAIALRFVDFRCSSLTLVDLDGKGLDETKRLILDKMPTATVLIVQKDLTEEDTPEGIVRQTVEKFKTLSYLANCAGIPSPFATSQDTPLDVFDKVQSVNVRATWRLQRAAVKQMLKQELVNGEYVKAAIFLLNPPSETS